MRRNPLQALAHPEQVAARVRAGLTRYGRLGLLLLLPCLVNALTWSVLAAPQRHALTRWREVEGFAETQPALEALFQESQQFLGSWEAGRVSQTDAAAVTQSIQRLGERYRADIQRVRIDSHDVEVEASGGFGKLGHWLSAVEQQPAVRVDTWTVTPNEEPGHPHRLMLSATAFLERATTTPSGTATAAADGGGNRRALNELREAMQAVRVQQQRFAPYDAVFRRDPLQAIIDDRGQLISSAGLSGGLSVQGIIWSSERPLAVIDDTLVAAGETAGPYSVVDIQPDRVLVQRGDERLWIPLDRGVDSLERAPSVGSLPSTP